MTKDNTLTSDKVIAYICGAMFLTGAATVVFTASTANAKGMMIGSLIAGVGIASYFLLHLLFSDENHR